jgi:hypothetical protein
MQAPLERTEDGLGGPEFGLSERQVYAVAGARRPTVRRRRWRERPIEQIEIMRMPATEFTG